MIFFVTKNTDYYKKAFYGQLFKDITVLTEQEGKELYFKHFAKKRILAFDCEATGLDSYLLNPILYGLSTKTIQLMYDWTADVTYAFKNIREYNTTMLGHNLLYDFRLVKVHVGVELDKCYDTMLAEQRLYMRLGYEMGLAALIRRYLKKEVEKEVRNEFIGANLEKFKIAPHHLYYLKQDLVDLFEIRDKQRVQIRNYKMEFLIYGIEFPLMRAIAEAELRGFVLNVEKWKERIENEKKELFELLCTVDQQVRDLRDEIGKLNPEVRMKLSGGKYDNIRKYNPLYDIFKPDGTTTEIDLFGNFATKLGLTKVKKKVISYPNNTNYKSPVQLIRIFAALGYPLLNKAEQFEVPIIRNNKIVGGNNKFMLNEKAFNKYLILKPDTDLKDFITNIIKIGKIKKSLDTYGESFIGYINPITGRLHTVFRQCFADTGRFQSGGGDKQPDKPNFQNIPKTKEYREAFTTDTSKYMICTSDYSGAELLVMASHAQDFKLIELSKQDMHSYMAQRCWRTIYKSRAYNLYLKITSGLLGPGKLLEKLKDEYRSYKNLSETFIVSKEENKKVRDGFKSQTFGIIYRMYAKKAGETINVSKEEGQITIDVVKAELPLTSAMVDEAVYNAVNNGFLILNERTNSRAWFPVLIQKLKGVITDKTHFMQISKEEGAAANSRMQGTQADFVKEATVILRKFIKKNGIDARILSWVHDEIIDEFPKEYATSNGRFFYRERVFDNYPDFKTHIMEDVANKYLTNVTIEVETTTLPYWTK